MYKEVLMIFRTLTEDEFRYFLDKHPLKTFLQTPEIAQLRESIGWKKHYVGVEEGNKLVAGTMMVSRKNRFGVAEFYAPRGFLIDYQNQTLLTYFVKNIKAYVKKQKGYVLRIDPYLPFRQRDTNGDLVEGGIDNRSVVSNLKSLGFKQNQSEEQAKWMYVLDIDGKTSDELMKNMKSNTRNNIRKTLKTGILLQELGYDELDQFYQIMVDTGKRKHFEIRSLDYFQKMYQLYKPRNEIKYLVAKLNLEDYIKNIQVEIEENLRKKQSLSDAAYNDSAKKTIDKDCENLQKRIDYASDIMKEKGKEITLSGSMFVMTQPEIIYLSSGNYEEYMKFYAQYRIQWEMIQYAVENGFKRYNFYGIMGNFDPNDPDYGIYSFKKGFNGYVEELIGEFELPTSVWYNFIKLIHR